MGKNRLIPKQHSTFLIALIFYSVCGLLLFNYYQYQINPDGISYISIAQKYIQADFTHAISGHWSPLFSWLLIPFLLLGIKPLWAAKILSLIIGLFTLIGARSLSYKFEMAEGIRNILLFMMVPLILFFIFFVITPDLLVVCILLFYLTLIFDPGYPDNLYKGAVCGAMGGMAYLTKSYAFCFFILHFPLFNLFHYLRAKTKKKKIGKNLALGMITFALISVLWISLINDKYNILTISTAGSYNNALIHPKSQGHPMDYQGFLKPPNATAQSAWEDPFYLNITTWNFMESWDSMKYGLKVVLENIYQTIFIYQLFSRLSITIFLIYLLFCILPLKLLMHKIDLLYPLITFILYSSGYLFLIVEERYLWLNCLLLIFMAGYCLTVLFRHDFFDSRRKAAILIILIFSFTAKPMFKLIQKRNLCKDIYTLSSILKNQYQIGHQNNIASNNNWHKSLYLTYYLDSKYFGIARKNWNSSELESELKKNEIDYYIVWIDTNYDLPPILNHREITGGKLPAMRVYAVRENDE